MRRRPTTATTVANAANIDDDEATKGGRSRPTAATNDNEATSCGRRRPTTARTATEATNVDNDEATNGRRCRPTADINDDEVESGG